MNPVISITLLLLSATVGDSWKRLKMEEDFPSQLKHHAGERAENHEEEILQDRALPGSCSPCKSLVSKLKQQLGKDCSKIKIEELLNTVCDKLRLIEICKKIVNKYKSSLIDAIANHGTPTAICKKLKLCKRNARL
ncbi:saposin-C [Lates calcarifer]|uniref:Saposin-C n=1 Tax=Lates calcarifer TaxID=8187 RepID=A0A4W6F5U5_LATCA|nr:saposin-C [Lates calcarifer]